MKEIISELGVLEGNKYKDLRSIDEEIISGFTSSRDGTILELGFGRSFQ
ncbi:MAG: hypothetical protein ACKKMP_02680 [Candidatus Nealsonbacteria bacterium]